MDSGLLLAWISAAIFGLGICTSAILVIVEGRRQSEAHAFQLELISKRIAQSEARMLMRNVVQALDVYSPRHSVGKYAVAV